VYLYSLQLVLALSQNTTLRTVNLIDNPIPINHQQSIAETLKRNAVVEYCMTSLMNSFWSVATSKNLLAEEETTDGGTRLFWITPGQGQGDGKQLDNLSTDSMEDVVPQRAIVSADGIIGLDYLWR
jgi:hypothetical protein